MMVATLLLLILMLLYSCCSVQTKSLEINQEVTENFQRHVESLFNSITGFESLKNTYENQVQNGILSKVRINVADVSKTFSEKLSTLLLSYLGDLNRLKSQVQISEEGYVSDPNIQPFDYYSDKNNNTVKSEPVFSMSLQVNLNRSFGHVPTEIFEHSKVILNNLKWMEDLDKIFLSNFKRNPMLLWQYFGSETGAARTFPGLNYASKKVDLYDSRRRLWYNQAINSPKDVVLALDMSGSMTGNHFTTAKLVVQSLIDTLQQDDFFNVLWFNSNTGYVIPCRKKLSQATSYYKKEYKYQVNLLKNPTGEADFPNALRTAFELVRNTHSRDATESGCTKVLILISDGIDYDDRIGKILAQYNGDKRVVIFSYIIGLTTSPEMKSIACNNGGAYFDIPTLGNVLSDVLKYQKILSKPLGESNKDYVIFTPLYLDGSGLGMMTTISTAIFSIRNSSRGALLGVAGLDIIISLLQQQYPLERMGGFGHAFAINNNGLFLLHPKFKDQSGYLPDPATVYLDDVENTIDPAKAIQLKKDMINGKTGCLDAEIDWFFPRNNERVIRLNNTYCYSPIKGTPFYAGVSMPDQNKIQVIAVKEKSSIYTQSGIDALVSYNINQRNEVAEWLFCNISTEGEKLQPVSSKYYPTGKDLYHFLKEHKQTNIPQCDEQMLSNLILSASTIMNYTKTKWSIRTLKEHTNILDAYIVTASGYMTLLSLNFSNSQQLNRDIFEEARFIHPMSFFNKECQNDLIFTVNPKQGKPRLFRPTNDPGQPVAIGKTIYTTLNDTVLAVVGITVLSEHLAMLLVNSSFNNTCDLPNCVSLNCKLSDKYQCYLIDENGYVVVSNQGNYQVGYFLGYFNGNLIRELRKNSIFEVHINRDIQAECPLYVDIGRQSNANQLQTFYKSILSMTLNLTSALFSIASWVFSRLIFTVPHEAVYSDRVSNVKNVSCTKNITVYKLTNQSINHSGVISCLIHCRQFYSIKSIPGTNLAMVATSNECANNTKCPNFIKSNKPMRVEEQQNICERPLIRYRKPLSVCYKSTGNDTHCSYSYESNDEDIMIYLIVAFTVGFAIIVAMVISINCKRTFYTYFPLY